MDKHVQLCKIPTKIVSIAMDPPPDFAYYLFFIEKKIVTVLRDSIVPNALVLSIR
jgi:hypothetical protein